MNVCDTGSVRVPLCSSGGIVSSSLTDFVSEFDRRTGAEHSTGGWGGSGMACAGPRLDC